MKILGIDEAGKGCVIGPMIIGGAIIIGNNDLLSINKLGNLDSKVYNDTKRREIKNKLDKILDKQIIKSISPQEIDKQNILQLEINVIIEMIIENSPDLVYIDAPIPPKLINDFKNRIKNNIDYNFEIVAENKADKKYPIVGAASIIAKIHRDNEIEKIKSAWGDFGSGYPSDEKTISFLKEWYENNSHFPKHVRKSWSTVKEIMKSDQLTMYDLLDEE